MYKDLDWHIETCLEVLGFDGADLFERALAGEHDNAGAEFFGEVDAGLAGDTHLGGGVDGEVRRELAD